MTEKTSKGKGDEPPRVQCHRDPVKRTGERCGALAEPGSLYCRFHGGRAPSGKRSRDELVEGYREKLIDLGDKALRTLEAKLESRNDAVSLRASLEILDRAGAGSTRKSESHVTVTQKSELDAQIERLMSQQGKGADNLGVSAGVTASDEEDE